MIYCETVTTYLLHNNLFVVLLRQFDVRSNNDFST
nr:MAG TPA: hypothetical protein [Caudoviricetes sp.]